MTDNARRAQADTIGQAAAVGATAIGLAGLLAPRVMGKAYGINTKRGETVFLVRLFSTRNLVLGAARFLIPDRQTRQHYDLLMAGLNAVDAVTGLTAGQLESNTRLRGPLTSLAFGAAAAVVAAANR